MKMKKIILIFLMALLVASVFAYENDVPITGIFHMTVNSIRDDEFEVDEDGVWLVNSEIITTIHLNPDSILFVILVEPEDYNNIYQFGKNMIIENYDDSVKVRLPFGTVYNCNDVIRTIVCYGSFDNPLEQTWLAANEFKIIDYVKNKDCINKYENILSTVALNVSFENKQNRNPLNQQYFNLSGYRLVSPPSKGLYIHNGKKIIVK